MVHLLHLGFVHLLLVRHLPMTVHVSHFTSNRALVRSWLRLFGFGGGSGLLGSWSLGLSFLLLLFGLGWSGVLILVVHV